MILRPGIVAASRRRSAASEAADPYWDNVVLRMTFDDGEFTRDFSPSEHPVTNYGATQDDPAVFGQGMSSNSGYMEVPDSDDFYFGSGEFTIEGWTMHTVSNQGGGVITKWGSTGNLRSWSLNRLTGNLRFYMSSDGATAPYVEIQASSAVNNNEWFHFAVDKKNSSGVVRAYLNGVMVDSTTFASAFYDNPSIPLKVGRLNTTNGAYQHIDDIRITKGVARYASDAGFTIPAEAYPKTASGLLQAKPTVIAYSGANGSSSSFNATIPTGAAAGDTMVVAVGSAWGVSSTLPAGWTRLRQDSGANWLGDVVYGKLTATDISNGYVTLSLGSSGHYVYQAVAFDGTVFFGESTAARYSSAADPRTVDAAASVTTDMAVLLFSASNLWDDLVISPGTEEATVNVSSNGSSSINYYEPVSDGAFTMTCDYMWGNAGGQYLATIPVYALVSPGVPFSAVKALYGFEGAGTYLNDKSGNGHTVTPNGSWVFQSAGGVFGDSAGRSGTSASSRGTVAHSDDFIFDGAFTIEMFGKCFGGSTVQGLLAKWQSAARSWAMNWEYLGTKIEALLSTDGTTTALSLLSSTSISSGVYGHFCLERDDFNVVRLYVNGVMEDSGVLAGALFNNSTVPMEIGGLNGGGARSGSQDEIRITKGYARYASDSGFTVPAEAYPRS